ncbi:gamma-glutamyl kinase [Roseovarius rhodophyticola]|uniref:Gamma-glutamyl kinase n=1 Tax=Roseovarius rhodophyticola TaxID=3080827 RepID=A0ABZ2TE83_9RHOB|nr:gamma-glutamyl kinase [Roseovarius sp. W115]MDV2928223.1 gamma-glutamyl kinase [Roseovarius sp. W115]
MLAFSKEKLVFLSVPKTGTTAYQDALAARASLVVRDPPELKHAPVFRYNRFFRPSLEKFCGEGFDVLAVMREPIDWLGSWYRYRRRPGHEGTRTSTHELSFDEFVLAYLKGNRPPCANVGSQAKFLEPQKNGTAVTHLFRYEDQQGLTDFLKNRLKTDVFTRRLNQSPKLELLLSAEVETELRRKCAVEFALYDGIDANGLYTPLSHGEAPAHR